MSLQDVGIHYCYYAQTMEILSGLRILTIGHTNKNNALSKVETVMTIMKTVFSTLIHSREKSFIKAFSSNKAFYLNVFYRHHHNILQEKYAITMRIYDAKLRSLKYTKWSTTAFLTKYSAVKVFNSRIIIHNIQ